MKKSLFGLFIIIACISCNTNNIDQISEEDLRIHIEFLASDALMGREAGEPGNQAAAEYIVSELKQMKIKPADSSGSYFQKLDSVLQLSITGKNQIEIRPGNGNNNIIIGDVFLNLNYSNDDKEIKGPLYFAGYGYTDTIRNYNDFENIDINNKIVMIFSGSPFTDDIDSTLRNTIIDKIDIIKAQNAKAIICVFDHTNSTNDFHSARKQMKQLCKEYDNLNIYFISKNTAELILGLAGHNITELQNKIKTAEKPCSFEFDDLKIIISIDRKKQTPEMSNVIACIEGSDPKLKNECIIYTAHYDHIGYDSKNEIYNGADDNASGTAALLELAKTFNQLKTKPKRTILFAWMTGEEKGLLGSSYYVQHPIIPLEKTIACINLDMIGRVKENGDKYEDSRSKLKTIDSLFIISGFKSPELMEINSMHLNNLNLKADYNNKKLKQNSDHYPFFENNIPVLFYSTGTHKDYHTINDKAQKIDYTKVKRITQLAFLVGFDVANLKEGLSLKTDSIAGIN